MVSCTDTAKAGPQRLKETGWSCNGDTALHEVVPNSHNLQPAPSNGYEFRARRDLKKIVFVQEMINAAVERAGVERQIAVRKCMSSAAPQAVVDN